MGAKFFLLVASSVVVMGQSTALPASPQDIPEYVPITASGRAHWAVSNTIGPVNLFAGAFTSALATRSNSPPEYGPHWAGFAKRNGLRISGRAVTSLIEGSLGSLWGEDPRYFRAPGQPLKRRLDNMLRLTVMARNRAGHQMPAYARYIALPTSNILSNTWRPYSQTQFRDVVDRMAISLVSRVIANAFSEFGPDLFKRFSKKKDASASGPQPAAAVAP